MLVSLPRIALVLLLAACGAVHAASAQDAPAGGAPPLISEMVGTWDVQQRTWATAGADAVELPPAVAHRRLVGSAFLEEVMEQAEPASPAGGGMAGPFTRVSLVNYNAVSRQVEYVSLDTRAPQLMTEISPGAHAAHELTGGRDVTLNGGTFVAPVWGDATDAAFRYRIVVGAIQDDRQVVLLLLTPLSREGGEEFLAFEYVYTRRP